MVMTPDEFEKKMLEIRKRLDENKELFFDEECSHIAMDDLMAQILYDLGYEKGLEIFWNTPKWYA